MNNQKSVKNNIICAYEGTSIIEFYEKYFDTVYIILHPFLKVIDKTKIDFDEEYPDKNKISNYCELMTWKDFLILSDIENIETLDIALRNSIGGLNKIFQNKISLKKLNETSEKHEIYHPNAGMFEYISIKSICESFVLLGFDKLIVGNEFGNEKRNLKIKKIFEDKDEIFSTDSNLYSENNEILYTVHWDSHYTILCSNKENVERIVSKFNFEGFYCDKETDIYWSIKN
jgi:hypothetical protein